MIFSLRDKHSIVRTTLLLALLNLLVVGILGSILRLQPIFPFHNFRFRFWVHAHSHVAFLGWVFMVLAALIYKNHLPDVPALNAKMRWLILIFQGAVLGMLFTFPFTGYAPGSIFFSAVQMFSSIYFVILLFKWTTQRYNPAIIFLKFGLLFMVISGIGPIALGPIAAMGLKNTPWYDGAIYFYLHFQYNGWFTLAIIGLLLGILEQQDVDYNEPKTRKSLLWLFLAIIFTFGLSLLSFGMPFWVNVISILGAMVQILVIGWFLRLFWQFRKAFKWNRTGFRRPAYHTGIIGTFHQVHHAADLRVSGNAEFCLSQS